MTRLSFLTGCLLLLLAACSSNHPGHQTDYGVISIADCMEHPTELSLSQLGSHIHYVPLETTDSSLIGHSYSVQLLPHHILVSTGGRCLSFDKQSGKYLGSIGHKGEDPKGYSDANCQVHPDGKTLYFPRRPNKLIKYDLNNQYLGEVTLPKNISQGFYFTFADSLLVAHHDIELGNATASCLLYFNEQGEIKDSLPELRYTDRSMGIDQIASIDVFKQLPEQPNIGGLIYVNFQNGDVSAFPLNSPTLWKNEQDLHFRKTFNDTLYTIAGHTATPYLLFQTGPWHHPLEKMHQKEDTNHYVVVSQIMETPQRLFFIALQGLYDKREALYGIYNKEDRTTHMHVAKDGLTDDLTHFMPFYPTTHTSSGAYAALLEADKIYEWLDEHPDIAREGALHFLQELNEESNPVCVIVEP